jgi:hypothetical protein
LHLYEVSKCKKKKQREKEKERRGHKGLVIIKEIKDSLELTQIFVHS